MLANGCALALVVAVAVTGCGAAWKCSSSGQGGAYEECMRNSEPHEMSDAEKREMKRREEDKAKQLQRQREAKRREYDAAKPPCARNDANACMTVARYAIVNNHDKSEILTALQVACDGKVGEACFELGLRRDDVALLASGCEHGYLRACQQAATKDPSRAMTFDSRACELHDGLACERVAAIHAQHGDRPETEKYLRLACREARKAACQRLGEMAVSAP